MGQPEQRLGELGTAGKQDREVEEARAARIESRSRRIADHLDERFAPGRRERERAVLGVAREQAEHRS